MPKPSIVLPGYEWVPSAHNYRQPNGTFVKRSRVLDLLGDAITQNERTMLRDMTAYSEGRLDAQTWLVAQSEALKREYLQNAALGAGGWDRLTPADYGRIGGKLGREYARIANLAEQVGAKRGVAAPSAEQGTHVSGRGAIGVLRYGARTPARGRGRHGLARAPHVGAD